MTDEEAALGLLFRVTGGSDVETETEDGQWVEVGELSDLLDEVVERLSGASAALGLELVSLDVDTDREREEVWLQTEI